MILELQTEERSNSQNWQLSKVIAATQHICCNYFYLKWLIYYKTHQYVQMLTKFKVAFTMYIKIKHWRKIKKLKLHLKCNLDLVKPIKLLIGCDGKLKKKYVCKSYFTIRHQTISFSNSSCRWGKCSFTLSVICNLNFWVEEEVVYRPFVVG